MSTPANADSIGVTDPRDVDPLFGTLDDFDRLLERAHALGLKVMIDQVFGHTSVDHAWFRESRESRDNPKADWYVWADAKPDGTPPNNWLSLFGGVAWSLGAKRWWAALPRRRGRCTCGSTSARTTCTSSSAMTARASTPLVG